MSDRSSRILHLLTEAGRRLSCQAARDARAQGLSRPQWAILELIETRPGLTQREIAEHLDVEPITVARTLDRLETRQIVERRPDPRDRRVWRVHSGPAGRAMREAIWQARAALGDRITANLPEDVGAALENGLTRAVAAMDAASPAHSPKMSQEMADA